MNAVPTDCWQINLQEGFGGGEVYTGFLVKALQKLGVRCHVFVARRARQWQTLLPADTEIIAVDSVEDISLHLPSRRTWILSHGALPSSLSEMLASAHLLTGIAHMPPQGRQRDRYEHFHHVFGVSGYVVQGLRDLGIPAWATPLYGVADLGRSSDSKSIRQTSYYDWDRRKGRDRLLGLLEPLIEPLRRRPEFVRRPGVTLGIVSRLTPIKQFPQLFSIIVPALVRHPEFNLEIVGSGGYASVRDLRRALRPLGDRVRFWGHQRDVVAVYQQLDYLMTGLPEKEALGLNVIEAQACDTPVLAVNAPPFTETVIEGKTGFLYRDPREDSGAAFSKLLVRIADPAIRPHPVEAGEHLSKFSFDAFGARLGTIVSAMEQCRALDAKDNQKPGSTTTM